MPHYNYLILGGGMAADAAVQGIRECDTAGSIGLVSEESDPPYDRPPLTKGLWKGTEVKSIWRNTDKREVELRLGTKATELDLWRRQVTDEHGEKLTYDKLLLATGGRPRQLPVGDKQIIYYRTFNDYRRLRAVAEQGQRFAVLGGGFIASEIAAALALNGKKVTMVFPGPAIGRRMFPADLAKSITEYYVEKGVEVLAGQTPQSVEKHGSRVLVKTSAGQEILVNAVVAGLGIEPNVELAESAGLRVEDGIVVDEFLRTSHPDIFAAGDVASFYSPALHRRMRVEHEDNANTMGRLAGRNMAGYPQRYLHLPYYYSDLFDLGYEAVGELDSTMSTVADWKQPFREGVVYYQREGRVRGVLLWNVWGQVGAARQLIADGREYRPEQLREHLLHAA